MNDLSLDDMLELFNANYAVTYIKNDLAIIDETCEDSNGIPCIEFRSYQAWKQMNENVIFHEEVEQTTKSGNKTITTEKSNEISVANAWLKWAKRRSYNGVVFDPRWAQKDKPDSNLYNLWAGWAVTPKNNTVDTSPYWNHIKDIICDKDELLAEYIRKWLAHMIQFPAVLPLTAIVLRGKQGIGKGTMLAPLEKITGRMYGQYYNIDDIVGKFNGHLKDKILVHANEATWGGDKQKEGVLKGLITEQFRSVELKGKDKFDVHNYSRLIISSNNDWCVPVGMDDRRFVFCNVSDAMKDNREYFTRLHNLITQPDFLEKLVYELMSENLDGFQPSTRPTNNASQGLDIKLRSMDELHKFIFQWLDDASIQQYPIFDKYSGIYKVSLNDFYNEYQEWCKSRNVRNIDTKRQFSSKVFGTGNKSGLLEFLERKTENANSGLDDKRTTITVYYMPHPERLRKYFASHVLHQTVEWSVETKDTVEPQVLLDMRGELPGSANRMKKFAGLDDLERLTRKMHEHPACPDEDNPCLAAQL